MSFYFTATLGVDATLSSVYKGEKAVDESVIKDVLKKCFFSDLCYHLNPPSSSPDAVLLLALNMQTHEGIKLGSKKNLFLSLAESPPKACGERKEQNQEVQ